MQPSREFKAKRINVVGTSGSGKSTFSRRLARILDYPYVELDALHWGPDWTAVTDEVLFTRLEVALSKSQWVLDGNYPRTIPTKWKSVDVVIWLNFSFPTTVWRALRRAVHRSWTQQELWEGTNNRESFRQTFFSKDSALLWTITSHRKVKQLALRCMDDRTYSHIRFIRLSSPREAERFLLQLGEHPMKVMHTLLTLW